MQEAQKEAKLLLEADPKLEKPENAALRERVEKLLTQSASGWN